MIKGQSNWSVHSVVDAKCDFCTRKASSIISARALFSSRLSFVCEEHRVMWTNNRLNL